MSFRLTVFTTEASASTREIYKKTGVQSCKVTHHRTSALQYAGFEGLGPHKVNNLTNHILDKQHSAYQSQAEWQVSWTVLLISFYFILLVIANNTYSDMQCDVWPSEGRRFVLCCTCNNASSTQYRLVLQETSPTFADVAPASK